MYTSDAFGYTLDQMNMYSACYMMIFHDAALRKHLILNAFSTSR